MSISITTLNFADVFPFSTLDELLPDAGPFGLPSVLDSTLLSAFLVSNSPMHAAIPQLPTPVCTSDFPDGGRKRPRAAPGPAAVSPAKRPCNPAAVADCCICLEPLGGSSEPATLPCKHSLHRLCLFSLMTYPVLGARSMVRCPMCRYAVDRYDISGICDVSVPRIVSAARRCANLRKLTNGGCSSAQQSSFQVAARLIQGCNKMTADDGFVYNVAVLAIDRAVTHRLSFARTLALQLKAPRNRIHDPVEFIAENLACHVEVLMRTSNQVDASGA